MTSLYPTAPTTQPPTANVPRGLLLSLIVVPVGVVAWVLMWKAGFIASIVAFGIAVGAYYLYKLGARVMTVAGAIIVSAVTLFTVLLAFFVGILTDYAALLGPRTGLSELELLTNGEFIREVVEWLQAGDFSEYYMTDFLLALLFAGLGAAGTIIRAFRETKAQAAAAATAVTWPTQQPTVDGGGQASYAPAAFPVAPPMQEAPEPGLTPPPYVAPETREGR